MGSSGTANLHPPKIPLNNRVDRAKVRGAFINGQGIRRKVHEVGGILRNLDLDVIGIAETWLLPGERVEVDGYRWIGIPREGNVGRGGVGLFVRDEYEVEEIETGVEEEGSDEGMEIMWVRLRRKGLGDILIGVVYVTPQGLSKGMFKADQFVEFICDKRQQGEEILVMGDFNAHFDIGGKALDCRAKFLNRLNKVGGLRIMNFADFTKGKWTWQGREKQSVLDYILMSQELADSTSSMTIDDNGWFDIGSDHNLMFWESNDSYKMEQRSGEEASSLKGQCRDSLMAWKTKGKVDWAGYKIKVEEKMDSFAVQMSCGRNWSARERYALFLEHLNEAAEESLKKVYHKGQMHSKRKKHSWWDEEVKEAIKKRREACREHRKYSRLNQSFPEVIAREKVEEKWEKYLQAKQNAKDLVAEKRKQERDEVLEEFEKTGGYGGSYFWRKVKKSSAVKGMKRLRNSSGKLVLEEKEMAKIAREHFKRNAQGTTGFHSEENGQPDFERQRVKLEVEEIEKLEEPFSSLGVVRALKRMKRGKGVGIDKVSSEMFLGGGEILWQNLAALLNVCWEDEFIPVDWMDGIVVPLHKGGGGGDSCDIGNYREITLGSHIGKVFCSVLNARLSEVIESKILGEAGGGGGFRRNRRTTDQVFVVSGIGQIRRSQGKKMWMAFLDFKKAFPSVWREGFWEKMKEYGIDGKFLRVCQNLYCDVGARVRVGKVFSERYTIEEGLRQGCILSPSLFSLFLMDLADELERRGLGVKVTGTWMGACFFAGDIVLMAESGKELQCMLDVVYKYANRWKLRFNASKCGVLVVGQKKSGKLWALGKEGIKEVDEYKYLGVWINRQVTGHNHVNHLEGKALGLQNLARGGKFWRDEEDIKAGLTMWEVVCKPVLNYGAEVWACSSKTDEQRLLNNRR